MKLTAVPCYQFRPTKSCSKRRSRPLACVYSCFFVNLFGQPWLYKNENLGEQLSCFSTPSPLPPEILNVTVSRSCDCGKFFLTQHKIADLYAKVKMYGFYPLLQFFLHDSYKFYEFWCDFFALFFTQNFKTKILTMQINLLL